MTKTCKLPACGQLFTPENPKGEFCCVNHRVAYHRLVKLGEKLFNQITSNRNTTSMIKKVAKKPGSNDEPIGKQWIGPRQWEPSMEPAEINKRLQAMRAYRLWAQDRGLAHMVITREQVEGLLRQAKANPKLADIVFPKGEADVDKTNGSVKKVIAKKPALQSTEEEEEEDLDQIP